MQKNINPKPKFKRERNPNKEAYVSKEELYDSWCEARDQNKLTDRLAGYLYKLANRYSYSPSFSGYSFREDMVAEAVINLCQNWHKYDPTYHLSKGEQPNVFAYFTTACYRSFLKVIGKEKEQRVIRDELLLDAGAGTSWNFQPERPKVSDDVLI